MIYNRTSRIMQLGGTLQVDTGPDCRPKCINNVVAAAADCCRVVCCISSQRIVQMLGLIFDLYCQRKTTHYYY